MITTLPTRNPADLGAALYDARTPNANELAAVNVEKIKDRLIEVATEIGLSSGATAGSINEMRTAFTAGAYSSILRRIGAAYGSQRIGGGLGAPTVADDSTEGYLPGSWWVQGTAFDNPATLAFFVCIDATSGAAVWVQIGAPADTSFSSEMIAIADGVTLAAGDAVAFVSGRATKSDGRAGSVVQGYIGQCITGGTGDAGGAVFARVGVAGLVPAAGLTAGAAVYLSTSAIGAVSSATPAGLGALSQRVGWATSTTEFALQIDAPGVIDYCSPLDLPTNGIFYGRASSANVLASGRITTNGIADLFGTGRFATVDGAGSAPLLITDGGPGGDAWFFVKAARADRLRIVHDAGMSGTSWSGFAVHVPSVSGQASILSKTTAASVPRPFDFGVNSNEMPLLASEFFGAFTPRLWRADTFARANSAPTTVTSRGVVVGSATGSVQTASSDDVVIGNNNSTTFGFDGRIAAFALWNRALTSAEMSGLARWARREWML